MARGKPFKPGLPRPSGAGRKPGTRNKATIAAEVVSAAGADPFQFLAEIVAGTIKAPLAMRLRAAQTLCPFLAPTLKSVETISPEDDARLTEIEKQLGIATDAPPGFNGGSKPN